METHIIANRIFLISLTSRLITCLYSVTSRLKSWSFAYLLSGSEHIYWDLGLEVAVHSIGFVEKVAFKTARAIFFLKLAGAGSVFW